MRKQIYKKIMLWIFLLSCLGADAIAQDEAAVRLDMDDVVSMAIEASEDYQLKQNKIERYQEKYKEVRSQTMPQVDLSSVWTYNGNYPVGAQLHEYESSSTVSASQLLWAFGKVKSAVEAAKQAFDISHLEKDGTRRDVVYSAKYAYYSALLSMESYEVTSMSYENAVANKKILEERSLGGRVSKRDNIKISADIASRIPQVNDARAQMQSALHSLKVVTGVDADAELVLTDGFADDYEVLDYNTLEKRLLSSEPAVKALEATVELQDTLVKQAKAGYMPTVSAFGSCSYIGGRDGSMPDDKELSTYTAGGVRVDVPIFTSGETTAKLEQARINKKDAELNLRKLREDLLLQLHNSVSDYHGYIETLKANDEAVRLAGESFKLTQELFRSGQVSVTDLNDAELLLAGETMNRLVTLFNINITKARIERLTSRDNDDTE